MTFRCFLRSIWWAIRHGFRWNADLDQWGENFKRDLRKYCQEEELLWKPKIDWNVEDWNLLLSLSPDLRLCDALFGMFPKYREARKG